MTLRVLVVGAGTSFSTKDVEQGLLKGLRSHGAECYVYSLERRLDLAVEWLRWLWTDRGKLPEDKPSWADALYRAGVEALEMALRFQVDWVIVISAMFLHPDVLVLLRRAGVHVGIVFTESPYQDAEQANVASAVDVCWTNERSSVAYLRGHPHAARRSRPGGTDARRGVRRHWLAGALRPAARRRLERHRPGPVRRVEPARLALETAGVCALGLHRQSSDSCPVSSGHHRPEPVPPIARFWAQALVHAESLNPRAYELAACGVFHLSDQRVEGQEIFGDAVPTFTDADQLGALIREYLADPEGRAVHAQRARQAIRPHTYAARAAQLVADLEHLEARPFARGA
jgi:hypothetical protein